MNETRAGQRLEREDFGDVTVLRIKAPMLWGDEATESLFAECFTLIGDGRKNLVLNLDSVVLLASMAIGKLVKLMRTAEAAGGKLVLCKVPRTIEELLRVTRLADVFCSYDDEQEAVRSFA